MYTKAFEQIEVDRIIYLFICSTLKDTHKPSTADHGAYNNITSLNKKLC